MLSGMGFSVKQLRNHRSTCGGIHAIIIAIDRGSENGWTNNPRRAYERERQGQIV
jgi:hypothetical protein